MTFFNFRLIGAGLFLCATLSLFEIVAGSVVISVFVTFLQTAVLVSVVCVVSVRVLLASQRRERRLGLQKHNKNPAI